MVSKVQRKRFHEWTDLRRTNGNLEIPIITNRTHFLNVLGVTLNTDVARRSVVYVFKKKNAMRRCICLKLVDHAICCAFNLFHNISATPDDKPNDSRNSRLFSTILLFFARRIIPDARCVNSLQELIEWKYVLILYEKGYVLIVSDMEKNLIVLDHTYLND